MKRNLFLFGLWLTQLPVYLYAQTDTPEVSITPNPAVSFVDVRYTLPRAQEMTFSLYDLLGRLRHQTRLTGKEGGNRDRLWIQMHEQGVYLFVSEGDKWKRTQKLVKVESTEQTDQVDILHTDLSLTIRNLQLKIIQGTARITCIISQQKPDTIRFDLLKLTATKVEADTLELAYLQNDSQVVIPMTQALLNKDTLVFTISYGGTPVSDPRWGGFYFSGNYAYNMGVGMGSKPHSFGRCWFPCVDDFRERSTYTFHVTTDSGYKAVCNGLKGHDSVQANGSITWNWELHQPIPAYLASVAVGKYVFVESMYQGTGGTSIPILLATEAADTSNMRKSLINLTAALQCFESKFGPYPFERIGYVGVPFNAGAMEHATNIAYPRYAIDGTLSFETLFAHELSHMWWGNQVTCRTEPDMWLNEGWASYCESVFLECLYGKSAYDQEIFNVLQDVNLNAPKRDNGWLPVSGVGSDYTYGMHVYQKGALMAHNLRVIMSDSAFFNACRSYLKQYRFMDVSSEELRNHFQGYTSVNLLPFFDHWIYEKGQIDVEINLTGKTVKNDSLEYELLLQESGRYKTGKAGFIPVQLKGYTGSGQVFEWNTALQQGSRLLKVACPANQPVVYFTLNEFTGMALGKNTEKRTITQTGSLNLNNVLLSLNTTQIADSVKLLVEHHWVQAPSYENLNVAGIRMSSDRYWTVSGNFPPSFNCMAFFQYDGNPGVYLDEDFMNTLQTEDSLVLLFRPQGGTAWKIHTDHTFQPGTKTDKKGRFWVNKLLAGDYAFGIRDHSITGLSPLELTIESPVELFPNPVDERVWIRIPKGEIRQIRVFGMDGKLIFSKPVQGGNEFTFTLENWISGIYQVVLETDSGNMSRRFVKP